MSEIEYPFTIRNSYSQTSIDQPIHATRRITHIIDLVARFEFAETTVGQYRILETFGGVAEPPLVAHDFSHCDFEPWPEGAFCHRVDPAGA